MDSLLFESKIPKHANRSVEFDKNLSYFHHIIFELLKPSTRENALNCLSKERQQHPDLAPVIWHSFGSVSVLLQELISMYPIMFIPEKLTDEQTLRCCNTLAILQSIATHRETRSLFLRAELPFYVFPFIITTNYTCPKFEKLRLTSLGVIGSLLQDDDPSVVEYLINTEIMPLCLKVLKEASECSQTIAAYIIQKILVDQRGLNYVCGSAMRFYTVHNALVYALNRLCKKPAIILLKHIIHCYLCLSVNPKARNALKKCFPSALSSNIFAEVLNQDISAQTWLKHLTHNLSIKE